jgi:hypothetical protein
MSDNGDFSEEELRMPTSTTMVSHIAILVITLMMVAATECHLRHVKLQSCA